jgi:hypothetical protein
MNVDPFAYRGRIEDGRLIETARARLWLHDTGAGGVPLLLLGGFTAGHFVFDLGSPGNAASEAANK